MPHSNEEPIEHTDSHVGDVSIIDLDKIEDDDDDVTEIIDLVSPAKTIQYKKRMISQYLAENADEDEVQSNSVADVSNFAHDFGLSESFIINELNQFQIENSNVGIVMDEIVELLQK